MAFFPLMDADMMKDYFEAKMKMKLVKSMFSQQKRTPATQQTHRAQYRNNNNNQFSNMLWYNHVFNK